MKLNACYTPATDVRYMSETYRLFKGHVSDMCVMRATGIGTSNKQKGNTRETKKVPVNKNQRLGRVK